MDDPELVSLSRARSQIGRRAQVGGGLAIFLGVVLFVGTPPAAPGAPINVHQMALVSIVIGGLGVAAGTLPRWCYFDRVLIAKTSASGNAREVLGRLGRLG